MKITIERERLTGKQWLLVIALIIAFIAIVVIIANSGKEDDKKDNDLPPVVKPYSGEILLGTEVVDESAITISAPHNDDCVVSLKTRSGTTRISFFVRAGDTVTVGVPCEYLCCYFAYGDTWYGYDHLFGEDTYYAKDDKYQNYIDYTWEYTLYPVNDGNFSQTPIDEDEFR